VAKSASRHFAEYGGGGASFCLPPYFTKDGAAGMKASFRGPARSQSATDIGSFAGMPPSRNEKALAGC
jgi:hypothetical protein